MLSESHPAYLTQLRVSLAKAKEYADKAIMMITVISIGILCLQIPIGMLQFSFVSPSLPFFIGLFSLNIKLPKNSVDPPGPYNYFAMVLSLLFTIEVIFLVTVRRWWIQAKRTRSKLS